jgi:hypothetical protein
MGVKAIHKNVKKHHLYKSFYDKAWRAKQRALEMIFGSFKYAYSFMTCILAYSM